MSACKSQAIGVAGPAGSADIAPASIVKKTIHAKRYGTHHAAFGGTHNERRSSLGLDISPPEKSPANDRPVPDQNPHDQPGEMGSIGNRPEQAGHAEHQPAEHHRHAAGRDKDSRLGIEFTLDPGI